MQQAVFGDDYLEFIDDRTMAMSAVAVGYQQRYLQPTNGHATRENLDSIRRSPEVGHIVSYGYIAPDAA